MTAFDCECAAYSNRAEKLALLGLWTLAYLAGHPDMNITKRYVHPRSRRSTLRRISCAKKAPGMLSAYRKRSTDLRRMAVYAAPKF